MQLTYPDRYGLDADRAARVLADFRRVVEKNKITYVREGGPNMDGWLAEMAARHVKPLESAVYDLYLNLSKAKRTNCADWRGSTIKKGDKTCPSIFQHPPAQGQGDATFDVPLPAVKPGQKLTLRFATGFSGPTTNGVRFAILIDDTEVWSVTQRTLPPVDRTIDLTAHAGKRIRLTLRVNGLGDTAHDWANWVRPWIGVE
jgi:hypothetical protein